MGGDSICIGNDPNSRINGPSQAAMNRLDQRLWLGASNPQVAASIPAGRTKTFKLLLSLPQVFVMNVKRLDQL
jgi:hypothetical protein